MDLFSRSLSEIPRFLQLTVGLLLSPRESGMEIITNPRSLGEDSTYRQAAIFFGISLIVTELLRLPLLTSKANFTKLLLIDAGWMFVCLLILALLLYGVLKVYKSQMSRTDIINLSAYYAGVFLILVHTIQLGYFGLGYAAEVTVSKAQSIQSPPLKDLWGGAWEWLLTAGLEWFQSGAAALGALIRFFSFVFLSISFVVLLLWMAMCWSAYAYLSGFTVGRSVASLLTFLLLSSPIILLFILVRELALRTVLS